jgi:hypothetical protein
MPDLSPKKLLLTLVVDFSGSLTDEGDAASINDFVKRLRHELYAVSLSNEVECEIRCLCYSDDPQWEQEDFISLSDYEFSIPTGGRFSNFGKALDQVLCKPVSSVDSGKEVWIWISDGFSTDGWMESVEKLRTDEAYGHIARYAFHVPGDTRFESLAWFSGSKERVWNTTEIGSELFTEIVGLCSPEVEADLWGDNF